MSQVLCHFNLACLLDHEGGKRKNGNPVLSFGYCTNVSQHKVKLVRSG